MVEPIIGSVAGVELFPREYTNTRQGYKEQFSLRRAWDSIRTQSTIYGLVIKIVVGESTIAGCIILGIDVPFRVKFAKVCRLIRR